MTFTGSSLGQENCYAHQLLTRGLYGCPVDSRIGFGTATLVVPIGSQTVTERASLYALRGEPAEDRVEILFFVNATEPVIAALALRSVVEEAAPPYGNELATSIPLVEPLPQGPDLALETFDWSLGPRGLLYTRKVHGHTVLFRPRGMRLPVPCPRSGYPFEAIVGFADGSSSTAKDRVGCPRQ